MSKRICVPALLLALSGAAWANDDVDAAAEQVEAFYRQGDRQAAEQVELVQDWRQTRGVSVNCTFKSRPEGAVLTVRRQRGTTGAVAVSFPPGTFGAVNPRSKERYGRLFQDIMFLRAPVVVLREGQDEASVVVPVACGTYRRRGPSPGVAYELHAVERDTPIDRLLVQVCADDAPPSECETALAIWVAREGLGYQYLAERNFHSFAAQRPVGVQHGEGARQLLERSGVNADALPFYREGPQRERPEPTKEKPQQEQAPEEQGDLS
jgi:hypothetical protein